MASEMIPVAVRTFLKRSRFVLAMATALLLSFALFSDLPAASEGDTGNHVPHVTRNTDGD